MFAKSAGLGAIGDGDGPVSIWLTRMRAVSRPVSSVRWLKKESDDKSRRIRWRASTGGRPAGAFPVAVTARLVTR